MQKGEDAKVMKGLTILKPGLLTTIQDRGRKGYQQYG
jgi:hypothetical protein